MHPFSNAMPARRSRLACGLALAATILCAGAAAAARLVAVGDVHGDLAAFTEVLRAADVLDEADAWRGGDAWVVQVGDLLDRGPQLRGALEFAMALETKAAAAGGRYVQLLGNHEVMNVLGDLRYVTAENFAEFADAGSEERRQRAWREFRDWQRRRSARLGLPTPSLGSAAKKEWLAGHPPGWLEHREAFAPGGRYGRWLRERPSLLVVDRTLLVHGGLAPAAAESTLEAIDRRVHDEIRRFDELRDQLVEHDVVRPFFDLPDMILAARDELAALERAAASESAERGRESAAAAARRPLLDELLAWDTWSIHSAEGPLWFRGYSRWSDEEVAERLPALLSAFDVERVVVGHTPQAGGRIRMRLDGALFLIDTGMLASYVEGGRGSALEIVDGAISAIYAGEPTELLWGSPAAVAATTVAATPTAEATAPAASSDPSRRSWLGPDGGSLPFPDDDALVEFLATAPVVDDVPIGEGITRPRRLTLERDEVRARATFRTVEEERKIARLDGGRREMNFRDYYGFEPAAYQLGLLLGLDNIPPSTPRRVKREPGSVQLWIEGATTEKRRLEAGTKPPHSVRWLRQLQMMMIWDDLVGNTDRNQGNILFDSDWQMWLIDHTRAFRQSTDLVHAEKITWCEQGFYDRLRAVTDDEIRERMRGLLRPGEIRGILERRSKLVRVLETLVRERGAGAVLFRWDS
jgi:hypothetical protein